MKWASSHRRSRQFALIALDLVALVVIFFLMNSLRHQRFGFEFIPTFTFSTICLLVLFSNYVLNLYEVSWWNLRLYSPFRIITAVALPTIFVALGIFLFRVDSYGLIGRGVFLGSMLIYLGVSLSYRWVLDRMWRKRSQRMQWLFLGAESDTALLKKELELSGIPIQITDRDPTGDFSDSLDEVTGSLSRWDGLLVTSNIPSQLLPRLIDQRLAGRKVVHLQDFYEHLLGKIPIHLINPEWFLFSDGFHLTARGINTKLKRASDILLALLFLFFTAPFILLSMLIIRLESSGSALYQQTRVGQSGLHFTIWKLRSMRQDAEQSGAQWAQKADPRVTTFGKFIRLTRIDELPQLYNILMGDMSFIGPRPERPEFTQQLREKIPFYDFRHIVKPGLTGWAQINYPYGASEEDAIHKLQYELYYIKNFSFLMDIKIVLKTFSVVIFAKGR